MKHITKENNQYRILTSNEVDSVTPKAAVRKPRNHLPISQLHSSFLNLSQNTIVPTVEMTDLQTRRTMAARMMNVIKRTAPRDGANAFPHCARPDPNFLLLCALRVSQSHSNNGFASRQGRLLASAKSPIFRRLNAK
jgi:hypothetical protein